MQVIKKFFWNILWTKRIIQRRVTSKPPFSLQRKGKGGSTWNMNLAFRLFLAHVTCLSFKGETLILRNCYDCRVFAIVNRPPPWTFNRQSCKAFKGLNIMVMPLSVLVIAFRNESRFSATDYEAVMPRIYVSFVMLYQCYDVFGRLGFI